MRHTENRRLKKKKKKKKMNRAFVSCRRTRIEWVSKKKKEWKVMKIF